MNQLPKFNSTIKRFFRSLFKYHFIYTMFTLCSVYSFVGTTCFMNRNNIFNSCRFVTIWLWLGPKPFSLSLHAFLDIAWILFLYDDVIKWKHFSALLAICVGNSPVTAEFPTQKGQWRGALIFSLISAWINCWENNREAGDLRRRHAPFDVTVKLLLC